MKAKSIKEMTLEILKSAVRDKNNTYADAMYIAESMRTFFYRWYIEAQYTKFLNGGDARAILKQISNDLECRVYNRAALLIGERIEIILCK